MHKYNPICHLRKTAKIVTHHTVTRTVYHHQKATVHCSRVTNLNKTSFPHQNCTQRQKKSTIKTLQIKKCLLLFNAVFYSKMLYPENLNFFPPKTNLLHRWRESAVARTQNSANAEKGAPRRELREWAHGTSRPVWTMHWLTRTVNKIAYAWRRFHVQSKPYYQRETSLYF